VSPAADDRAGLDLIRAALGKPPANRAERRAWERLAARRRRKAARAEVRS
jgi:hypothetical protein